MSSIRDSYISRWWMPRRGLSRVLSGGSAGSNSNVGHSAAKIDCVSSAQTLIPSTIEIQTIAFLRDSNADGSYWFRRKSIDLNGRAKENREIAGKAERKKREREREREREQERDCIRLGLEFIAWKNCTRNLCPIKEHGNRSARRTRLMRGERGGFEKFEGGKFIPSMMYVLFDRAAN